MTEERKGTEDIRQNAEASPADENQKTVSEILSELEALAEKLEDRDTSLEESFALYRKGMGMLHACSERLDLVEKKMLEMEEDGSCHEFS